MPNLEKYFFTPMRKLKTNFIMFFLLAMASVAWSAVQDERYGRIMSSVSNCFQINIITLSTFQEGKIAISTSDWTEFPTRVTADLENMECAVRCTQESTCQGNLQLIFWHTFHSFCAAFVTSESKCFLVDKKLVVDEDFKESNSTKSTYYEKVMWLIQ